MAHRRLSRFIAGVLGMGMIAASASSCVSDRRGAQTQVLVVGTVHQQHATNPNYSYEHLVSILSTYDPDVICVEIEPQDFRREHYLREMLLATVWGLSHNKQVHPIDWSSGDSTRRVRARLQQEPEFKLKQGKLDSLRNDDSIVSAFKQEYGDFWQANMGYRFYNGREYNDYIREGYRLSMAVYGDGPMNLYYETRNARMLDLIRGVISENVGARIVVLTGAEHKHYFDLGLAEDTDISVIPFEGILPLDHGELEPALRAFFDEDDDLGYYAEGYPADIDQYYQNKIIRLVHGPDMDWNPEIIPPENVSIAKKVLRRWNAASPGYARLRFEQGWLSFLAGDYEAAIENLNQFAKQVNAGTVDSDFLRVYTYRNLGLCYDVVGARDQAILSYSRASELMAGTRLERSRKHSLKNYLSVPYQTEASRT